MYPSMPKSSKHLPNCLERAETITVLVVFDSVLCEVNTYTVTVSYCRST